jgi:ubiquinone/menaquinone biosynthesis C-methylase UbiE
MDHIECGRLWDQSAEVWTRLARAGYDVYRNHINAPAFLAMLPEVRGRSGLDIGCGEGYNTRLIADRGARMTAIDISPKFIAAARELEEQEPHGIRYEIASAVALPFPDGAFEFAVSTMVLMNIPEADRAIAEAHRVIRPGGFFQFSILHPFLSTPFHKKYRDENGKEVGYIIGGYFEEDSGRILEWLFGAAPPQVRAGLRPFRLVEFHRTLSWWFNTLIGAGFRIERIHEPYADDETARRCPDVADTRLAPYFLHIRCRRDDKQGAAG